MEEQVLINAPIPISHGSSVTSPGISIGGTAFSLKLQPEDLNPRALPFKILKIACQTCGKYLPSIEEWKMHRILTHGDRVRYGVKRQNALWKGSFGNLAGEYPCPTCRTPFLTSQSRDKHFKTLIAYPMLTCRLCKTFHRNMELHVRTCHPEVSNCAQCDATNIGNLVDHCDNFHEGFDVTWHEVSLDCFGDGKGFSMQETILNISLMLPGKNFGIGGTANTSGHPSSLLDSLPIYYEKTTHVKAEHFLGLPLLPMNRQQSVPEIYSAAASPLYKCRVCGFLGRTQRKRDEMINHAITEHFGDLLNNKIARTPPYLCPQNGCNHTAGRKWTTKQHFFSKHIGKKMLYE